MTALGNLRYVMRDVRPTSRITYRNPKPLPSQGFSRLAVRAVRWSWSGSRKNVPIVSHLPKWPNAMPSNTFASMEVAGSIFIRVGLPSTYRTYRTTPEIGSVSAFQPAVRWGKVPQRPANRCDHKKSGVMVWWVLTWIGGDPGKNRRAAKKEQPQRSNETTSSPSALSLRPR